MIGNQLKKQAKLRESLLAIAVILVVSYALYANLYVPNATKVKDLRASLSELVTKGEGVKKLIDALQKRNTEQESEAKKQAQMQAKSDPRVQLLKQYKDPVFANVSEFLNALNQYEFRSGVELNGIKYGADVNLKGYTSTTFSLNVSGRFSNVLEFVRKLEELPVLISLDKITIEVNKTDAKQVIMELGGIYFQLESKNV